MNTQTKTHPHARLAWQLWTGILLAPFVWLTQMETNYALVPWVCANGKRFVFLIVSLSFVLFSIAGAVIAARARKALRSDVEAVESGKPDLIQFMACVGFFGSLLFTTLIIFQTIPLFILGPCAE